VGRLLTCVWQIHFTFAGVEGVALGERVAAETLKKFDANWDKF